MKQVQHIHPPFLVHSLTKKRNSLRAWAGTLKNLTIANSETLVRNMAFSWKLRLSGTWMISSIVVVEGKIVILRASSWDELGRQCGKGIVLILRESE